jgi:hypothetical protein
VISEERQHTRIGFDAECKASLKTDPQIGPGNRADVAALLRAPRGLHLPTTERVAAL